MQPPDVVIAGAGPAGAATALRLARAGIPVTLIDRSCFPRRKVCGEYLGAGALRALDELGLADTARAAGAPLHGVRIAASGAELTLQFPSPALAITRERLDAAIVEAAVRAGAQLVRARVDDIARDPNGRVCGVMVRDEDAEMQMVRARFVIGADGIGSIVARKLSLLRARSGIGRFALGGHYRRQDERGAYIEMNVEPHAYFAINPLGGGIANVMAVVERAATQRWAALLDLAGASCVGTRVAIGPLHHRVRAGIADGALLVGDAAGFLDPFTGQGVFLALRGAERAARALIESFASSGREAAAMKRYEFERRAELNARARLATVVALLVRIPPLARRAAYRLQRSPALAATLLEALGGITGADPMLRPSALRRLLA